jgi:hypothetical protein
MIATPGLEEMGSSEVGQQDGMESVEVLNLQMHDEEDGNPDDR